MSFRFNFIGSGETADGNERNETDIKVVLRESEEIYPTGTHEIMTRNRFNETKSATSSSGTLDKDLNTLRIDENLVLYHFSGAVIEEQIKTEPSESENVMLKAVLSSSDLIPGEYEGGLKLWECTEDLLKHLNEVDFDLKNKKILDLGCGSGLLGIYALLRGSIVHFQDYNREVLHMVTIPNVFLNAKITIKFEGLERCRYFAGDWSDLPNLLGTNISESEKYDVIFTSETIYNPTNYKSLVSVFKHCLKQNGEIYLAAKSVYFGVGGSVDSFKSFLTRTEIFDIKTCKICTEGVKREILRMTFLRNEPLNS